MGMFDWYEPDQELQCPVCGAALSEWQGKDGECALFVWGEGEKHPIDQAIDDEDVRLAAEDYVYATLPEQFEIYSYDCSLHQPIVAACSTDDNGVWSQTRILPYKRNR